MALKLYNTLKKRKEVFKSKKKGEVRIYSCGPTVYTYAHIGNFRSYIFSDLLSRYLEWKGFKVRHIMNITDVGHMTGDEELSEKGEDKIEKAAREQKKKPEEIARFFEKAFFEDAKLLNLRKAEKYPRASEHVKEMIGIVGKLVKKGYAYNIQGNVYFDINKFSDYGKLSGNTLKNLQAGKRVAVRGEKKNPFDFALWIKNPNHIMQWPSPWGKGYPGWHLECSAMSLKYLGEDIDIHTGGEDNIFPHHECEIAQSQASTGRRFVRYWLHARHLQVEGKKMSKRLGNFYTIRDLVKKGHNPLTVRFLLLSSNYRTKMNLTEESLKSAEETVKNLRSFVSNLKAFPGGKGAQLSKRIEKARKGFESAMDDDLNISLALSSVFDFVRDVNGLISEKRLSKNNVKAALDFISDIDKVLALDIGKGEEWLSLKQAKGKIKDLILKREEFRKKKSWREADKIRNKLKKEGIILEDTESGVRWRKD
jgi:cysteinyl-tRNA synthetase